ncbi:MAG TPA: hypothetical protein VIV60_09435 [Polyangiaceae bacterium]
MRVHRTLPRVALPILVFSLGLVTLQVGTWALWGRETLVRRIPEMARTDLLLWRDHVERSGDPLYAPDFMKKLSAGKLVILKEDAKVFDPALVASLRALYESYGGSVFVEPELPVELGFQRGSEGSWECKGCKILEAEVSNSLPIHGKVIIEYKTGHYSSSFYEHRFIWCLGIWIPTLSQHASDT